MEAGGRGQRTDDRRQREDGRWMKEARPVAVRGWRTGNFVPLRLEAGRAENQRSVRHKDWRIKGRVS